MSSYHSHHTERHKCQIDCTNHEQVINNLEVKSKDLYFFWRNYEWLYQKYYSREQPEDISAEINRLAAQLGEEKRSNAHLSEQLEKYRQEIRRLENENQSLRNKPEPRGQSGLQEDYKREINRQKNKIIEYEGIIRNLQSDVNTLEGTINSINLQLKDGRQRYDDLRHQYQTQISEKERKIEELRLQITSNIPSNIIPQKSQESNSELLYKHSLTASHNVSEAFRQIKTEAMRVVDQEMERTRSDLKQQIFANLLTSLKFNLNSFIVDDDFQPMP